VSGGSKQSETPWAWILEHTGYKPKVEVEILDQKRVMSDLSPQYMTERLKQCWEDWRHYNSIIWHMPSLTTAIVGGLVGVAFCALSEPILRAILNGLAALFSFSMVVALVKHRYFHDVRTALKTRGPLCALSHRE
jgi:hypothetical protein